MMKSAILTCAAALLLGAPMGCAPELDESHKGWKDPACWQCHDKGDTHNSDKDPHECAECHGNNGAPGRKASHVGSAPCSSCHGTKHGGAGFPDPGSCTTCHP